LRLYLSQNDIEIIGESVLRDYATNGRSRIRIPFDISEFARQYLKLAIHHRKLSESGKILGLTTYKDVELELELGDGNVVVTVPEDTILLDESLEKPDSRRRGRFTVAHECAHQVIARIEEQQTGSSFRKALVSGRTYSCRELKTAEDWCEWQANSLGAVLLMPRNEIAADMDKGFKPFRPTLYGSHFNTPDYYRIRSLADRYGVSITAMILRLKELGYICRRPESEYSDPLDIIAG